MKASARMPTYARATYYERKWPRTRNLLPSATDENENEHAKRVPSMSQQSFTARPYLPRIRCDFSGKFTEFWREEREFHRTLRRKMNRRSTAPGSTFLSRASDFKISGAEISAVELAGEGGTVYLLPEIKVEIVGRSWNNSIFVPSRRGEHRESSRGRSKLRHRVKP